MKKLATSAKSTRKRRSKLTLPTIIYDNYNEIHKNALNEAIAKSFVFNFSQELQDIFLKSPTVVSS